MPSRHGARRARRLPSRAPGRVPRGLRAFAVLTALTLAFVPACTHSSPPAHASPSPSPGGAAITPQQYQPGAASPPPTLPGDWLTYHHDATRSGDVPDVPPPSRLARSWSAALDGAVYGQPLVVRGLVVAATENDSVYALDRSSGRVVWRTRLGTPAPLSSLPCGDIDPLGITSTPVYEPTTGLVFVVAELAGGRHLLAGIDPVDGTVRVRREVEPPRGTAADHQQRGALTAYDGRILVAFGGLEGDCGDYVGAVVSAAATGAGPLLSYAVPTARQGGIWAPGGPVLTAGAGGRPAVMTSVGNGAAVGGAYDGSDSVVALDPKTLTRTDVFAPSTWAADNAHDLDLGSLTPAVVGRYLLAVGKSGTGYTLDAARLGGVGGQVAQASLCNAPGAFGATAVVGSTVFLPCADGLVRVDVDAAGSARPGWRLALAAAGSPVVGGGAVWVADYAKGVLYALDPATGRALTSAGTGTLPHFASPVLTGGQVLLGTETGVLAFGGA
ncbi:outer membrane protein assembly factor BamB family protein [Streptacidiphilus fuscans]|uniref:PQQ-binding-like beta-propeller repeat protein n=1 Tax=Streptacidiphilus fuscans TaxID=2789292 RepID=A0A931FAJ2_9ACTN|nr:PQQ-binding-like beta-propeller repeat protein [Streptacidiphilus fuscans]MBF9066453.1 PQQ-binding-like beta-propeller repeat protein [Streptacidiphilus fuscans]